MNIYSTKPHNNAAYGVYHNDRLVCVRSKEAAEAMAASMTKADRELSAKKQLAEGAPALFSALNSAQQMLMAVACQPSSELCEQLRANLRAEAIKAVELLRSVTP